MVSAWLAYASNPGMTKCKNAESVFTEPLNKSKFALVLPFPLRMCDKDTEYVLLRCTTIPFAHA